MRFLYSLIFLLLIVTLTVCSIIAKQKKTSIGDAVALLDASLIPPVIGNLIVTISSNELLSTIGFYIFFLGMDIVMFATIRFTVKYCEGTGSGQKVPIPVYLLLIADAVQILLNTVFHHAFVTEELTVDGSPYYRFVPYFGQTFHRILDYSILFAVLLVFAVTIHNMPRIYRERYTVIVISMVLAGAWQGFYIISRTPIDRSMIGLAFFGIVIFYFSICYKPVRLLDRMLSKIVSEMTEALFVFDLNGKCIWANDRGYELCGVTNNKPDKLSEKLIEMFGDPEVQNGESIVAHITDKGREVHYYSFEENKVTDEKDKLTGIYLAVRDITEEKMQMKRDIYDATHDRLTGLYTREYLYSSIMEVLETPHTNDHIIIFIDVKNFKIVNDVFGNDFGDYALICISNWIRKNMTAECRYGRLAGDTFGVFMPSEGFHPEKVENDLSHFVVKRDNAVYQLLIHLGIYKIDSSDNDVSVMFDRAHLSLSTISDEYNTHIAYYDNEIRSKVMWAQTISNELDDALKNGEIRPYLQPIADENGRIVGAEALARWIHSKHGFLSPASFIPIFEKNGMIIEVDKFMWHSACSILSKWGSEGRDLFLSVNISPKDFYFMDVASEIKTLVKEHGIDPKMLRTEITETVMMNESDNRIKVMDSLRESGFIIEMDDFGSGYSSLNMLKDMNVDVLKIDMNFLGKSSDKNKARTIVKNVINLSKELGIVSLTEGVETEEQYRILLEMGCKLFQGYYFSKPIPVDDFEKLLEKQNNA